PDHRLTVEVAGGWPHLFRVAFELSQERFDGDFQNKSFSVELRYALADWNKVPLNPTLFAEYKFGTGRILHEERPPEEEMAIEEMARLRHLNLESIGEEVPTAEEAKPKMPDAYEFRLLLAEDFSERIEWAMNWYFEQEIGLVSDRADRKPRPKRPLLRVIANVSLTVVAAVCERRKMLQPTRLPLQFLDRVRSHR